jgi:hypothetical protein
MDANGFRPDDIPSSDPDSKSSSKMSSSTKEDPLPTPPIRLGEPSDAVLLGSTTPSYTATPVYTPTTTTASLAGGHTARYYDDDPAELGADDLPPLYTDVDDYESHPNALAALRPLGPPRKLDAPVPVSTSRDGTQYLIDRRLDTDPEFLAAHLEYLAAFPPRQFVQVRGTHTETVRRDKNKTETNTVTDFDVQVEMTPFLYSDISRQMSWAQLRTADNFEKVRRGGVFASSAPGFGGKARAG